MIAKLLEKIEIAALVIVPVVLLICSFYDIEYTAIFTLVVVILAIVPFFVRFEMRKFKPREFMHIVVLSAIAVVGRIVCAPISNIQPVTAIIIVCGLCYGKQSGFLTGALAALVSNMFFGQGPWTPWQMYSWGLIGYLAGAFGCTKMFNKNIPVYIFGFIAAMFYGFIMDSWHVIAYLDPTDPASALLGYASGFVFNIMHAVSTVVFLIVILLPWRRKLERIKLKFGIDKR